MPALTDKGYCPTCDIVLSGKFCRTCGTILIPKPPNPNCPSCGEELSENDRYCRWCAHQVEMEEINGDFHHPS